MKVKTFIAIMALAFAGSVNMMAQKDAKAELATLLAPAQTAIAANHYDAELVQKFFSDLYPQLRTPAGKHTLQLMTAATANGKKKAPTFPGIPDLPPGMSYDMLLQIINQIGIDKLQDYIDKVIPVYTHLMSNRNTPPMADEWTVFQQSIYRTPVDAAFYGIGDERNYYNPYGLSEMEQAQVLAEGGKLKRSGSYVWGMTHHDDILYWSTNNNYLCTPGYSMVATTGESASDPVENSCWVCEMAKGSRAKEIAQNYGPQNALYGDIVQPRIFAYNTNTGVVADITPVEGSEEYKIISNCQGLRSAYSFGGIVFFGGPALFGGDMTSAVASAFVAYDPETGMYIGASDMKNIDGCQITNVRRWMEIDGVLYCGVGLTDVNGVRRGAVLRWYGDKQNPFEFHIVGWTPGEAAEIELHDGRIYVGGWPVGQPGQEYYPYTEVYQGPEVPEGGLQPVDIDEEPWPAVWTYQNYDPTSCYTCALKSFKGRLYWGTFGSAYGRLYATKRMYQDITSPDALAFLLSGLQTTTLWSATDFSTPEDTELLYGEKTFMKKNQQTGLYEEKPNGLGLTPKWGRGGYGNIFTSYTWALQEYNNHLYIGTMDYSDMLDAAGESSGDDVKTVMPAVKLLLNVDDKKQGFEIVRIKEHDIEPEYITDNAFGNPANYGVRNFEVVNDKLYVGSASPLNIHENGGWQIFCLEELNWNDPTAVCTPSAVKAGLFMKRCDGYVAISTVGGEDIQSVTMTDLSGRQHTAPTTKANMGYIFNTEYAHGVYVLTVKTSRGQWSTKVTL